MNVSNTGASPVSANYQSHFGVYALIFNPEKTKILLIKKTLGCYTGLYDLPGGTMEPHELLEETLKREVREETDCMVTSCKQLGAFSTLYPFMKNGQDLALRHLAAIYVAEIAGTPRIHATGLDDSGGCVWIELEKVTKENSAPLAVDALYTLRSST